MSNQLEFHILNDHLLNMGAVHSASELQGFLCGQLSGGKQLSNVEWIKAALEFLDLSDLFPIDSLGDDEHQLLSTIHTETIKLLEDSQLSFTPLLPTDASSIERRIDELACWCQGFLHGVGMSGLRGGDTMSAESAEALRDLAQICQVSLDTEDNDADDITEQNERYWNELIEYVRAAVLLFYTDVSQMNHAADVDKSASNTIH